MLTIDYQEDWLENGAFGTINFSIDFKNNKLEFSGANNPLIIIRDGEIHEYKGNKQPVGMLMGELRPFTNHVIDIQKGDILIIKTGWYQYGWNSPDSDEFRYMIKHPGPSPDFGDWCIEKKIKWLGIDCVAMEHPMNTSQRIWHPKTFAEANN